MSAALPLWQQHYDDQEHTNQDMEDSENNEHGKPVRTACGVNVSQYTAPGRRAATAGPHNGKTLFHVHVTLRLSRMIHQRTREALSVFTGALVLIVSLVSGCFSCLTPAADQAAKGPEHAFLQAGSIAGLPYSAEKLPRDPTARPASSTFDPRNTFWSKVVTLDISDVVHSGSVLVAAIAPQANIFAAAPPGSSLASRSSQPPFVFRI